MEYFMEMCIASKLKMDIVPNDSEYCNTLLKKTTVQKHWMPQCIVSLWI